LWIHEIILLHIIHPKGNTLLLEKKMFLDITNSGSTMFTKIDILFDYNISFYYHIQIFKNSCVHRILFWNWVSNYVFIYYIIYSVDSYHIFNFINSWVVCVYLFFNNRLCKNYQPYIPFLYIFIYKLKNLNFLKGNETLFSGIVLYLLYSNVDNSAERIS